MAQGAVPVICDGEGEGGEDGRTGVLAGEGFRVGVGGDGGDVVFLTISSFRGGRRCFEGIREESQEGKED